jgi:hypothetical protein
MKKIYLLPFFITISLFQNSLFAQKEFTAKNRLQNFDFEDFEHYVPKFDSTNIDVGVEYFYKSKNLQSQGVPFFYYFTSIAFVKFNDKFYHFEWSENRQGKTIYNIVSSEKNKYFSKLIISYNNLEDSQQKEITKNPKVCYVEFTGNLELRDKQGKLFQLYKFFGLAGRQTKKEKNN